jgi:hypothetical protein
VKVPDGFAFAGVGAAVVAAGAGVVAVVVEEDDAVAFFVAVAVGAGVFAAWVAAGAGVVAVVVVVEVVGLPPSNFPPVDDAVPNCGGVMDRTAPRPPMVPPAISITLFAPMNTSPLYRVEFECFVVEAVLWNTA